MIKAKTIVVLVLFITGHIQSIAQTAKAAINSRITGELNTQVSKELNIGDQIPDITLNNIVNRPNESIRLSEFKGKVIIIDFWSTWCGSCIAAFPKLNSLQAIFKDQLIILAVTYQNKEKIKQFVANHKVANVSFPIITDDTTLSSLFPHTLYPHEVWISSSGIVQSITSSEQITIKNINAALHHSEIGLPVKRDLDMAKPLFTTNYLPADKLVHYSILLKGKVEGVPAGSRFRKSGDVTVGTAVTNTSLLEMYRIAIQYQFSEFNNKRIIISTPDSSELSYPENNSDFDDWANNNLYSYDLIVPLKDTERLYNYMIDDLNKYSQYTGKIEKRIVNCLVLVRTSKSDRIHTKGGDSENKIWNTERSFLKNMPISNLIEKLNAIKTIDLPVIDETDYKSNIDIEFLSKLLNLNDCKKELSKYDLDLRPVKREINMFVLTKKE